MTERQAFLVEIGTEELPPKHLKRLALSFLGNFNDLLTNHGLPSAVDKNEVFFSPRRIAIYSPLIFTRQPDLKQGRWGPTKNASYDENGNLTKAAEGFAKSCGITVDQLVFKLDSSGGSERLYFEKIITGKPAEKLLPWIVAEALAKLPIPKRMRWGAGEVEFVRPVHWVVMLLGTRTLKAEILGITASNKTYGHRYHHPSAITLKHPKDYRKALATTGKVLVEDRAGTLAKKISTLVIQAAKRAHGRAQLDEALVQEIAGLVEWPVPVTGGFDAKFLALPDEVIVAVLEDQQRYFPLRDSKGKLLPHFITLSNIQSRRPAEVKRGNERVIVPRLSDAMFFWETDRKTPLAARVPELDRVVFQKELGSYGDKRRRVAQLAAQIAQEIGGDPALAERAAELAKCDLLTNLVGEFPELQGCMGRYYAQHDGEPAEVAAAIAEQYLPRFAGDALPDSKTGQALAIADKLDTITGIFAIGQKPTGDKDPFALRRAGLGLMRILVERLLDLDLTALIGAALDRQPGKGQNRGALALEIYAFLLERLRAYYLETGIRADVFEAVRAKNPARPLDFDARVQAVNAFLSLPEAASLAAANKRISNILRQAGGTKAAAPDPAAFETPDERTLHAAVTAATAALAPLIQDRDYTRALTRLAQLRTPVDAFFDKVMVMTEDRRLRDNRLALLSQLQNLFMHTADLSLLQTDA